MYARRERALVKVVTGANYFFGRDKYMTTNLEKEANLYRAAISYVSHKLTTDPNNTNNVSKSTSKPINLTDAMRIAPLLVFKAGGNNHRTYTPVPFAALRANPNIQSHAFGVTLGDHTALLSEAYRNQLDRAIRQLQALPGYDSSEGRNVITAVLKDDNKLLREYNRYASSTMSMRKGELLNRPANERLKARGWRSARKRVNQYWAVKQLANTTPNKMDVAEIVKQANVLSEIDLQSEFSKRMLPQLQRLLKSREAFQRRHENGTVTNANARRVALNQLQAAIFRRLGIPPEIKTVAAGSVAPSRSRRDSWWRWWRSLGLGLVTVQ